MLISVSSEALRGQLAVARAIKGRTDGHAESVTGDQPAGTGNRHTKVARHFRQQAHDDEFRGADGKTRTKRGREALQACRQLLKKGVNEQ